MNADTRPTEPPKDFLIRLRPVADDQVTILDLRRFLKVLGRSYRLRCVEAVEVPREGAPSSPPTLAPPVDGYEAAGVILDAIE